jgi:hypothetical protein
LSIDLTTVQFVGDVIDEYRVVITAVISVPDLTLCENCLPSIIGSGGKILVSLYVPFESI